MKKFVYESLFEFDGGAYLGSIQPDQVSNRVVDVERLSKTVLAILNEQTKNELLSSQIYRGMSCWLNDAKWPEGTKLFFKYADEELTHMSKIYQYIFDRNCTAVVPACEPVKTQFTDIREIVEAALQHEIEVTNNWEAISTLSKEEGDNTTYEFSQWFLKEQVEEEDKFRTILEKMDLDMPKYEIDELFGEYLG